MKTLVRPTTIIRAMKSNYKYTHCYEDIDGPCEFALVDEMIKAFAPDLINGPDERFYRTMLYRIERGGLLMETLEAFEDWWIFSHATEARWNIA